MNATLYFPVPDYDDSRFEYHGDIGSGQAYANRLYDSYRQGSAQLSGLCTYTENGRARFTSGSMGLLMGGHARSQPRRRPFENAMKYSPVNVVIMDSNGDDETIDNLIRYFQNNEPFPIIVKFPNKPSELDPDIDTELRYWHRDSVKINNERRVDEETRFRMLPTKDIRVDFGPDSHAVMSGVRLLQRYGSWEYAWLVMNITFTKELDLPKEKIVERKFI